MEELLVPADSSSCQSIFATCRDTACPPENILTKDCGRFWISTGLYPQEVCLTLRAPCRVASVVLRATKLRRVRIEGYLHGGVPATSRVLAEAELPDVVGNGVGGATLQAAELKCHDVGNLERVGVLRVVIESGWHDFCSVHNIHLRLLPLECHPDLDMLYSMPPAAMGPLNYVADANSQATPISVMPMEVAALAVRPRTPLMSEGDAMKLIAPLVASDQSSWILQVQHDGHLLRFAGSFTGDPKVVLAAVLQNGDALQYASAALRQDRQVAFAAVQQQPLAIKYVDESLRSDRDLACIAVSSNGAALEHLAADLRVDRDIVLRSVRQRGSALRLCLDPKLRGDPEVVEAACETFFFSQEELRLLATPDPGKAASDTDSFDSDGEEDLGHA